MLFRKFAATLALLIGLVSSAFPQAGVQLDAGQIFGNSTAAPRPGRAENVTAIFDRVFGSTRGAIIERGVSSWAIITPGTSGLPLASNGAGADPSYRTILCSALSNSAASCSTDATNASNISSGTLAAARGGAGTITGALKGNGAGVVSQAACADLSNGAAGCSTGVGTSGAVIGLLNTSNTYSGTSDFTGDVLFSGRPWCDVREKGAVGNGSTDDTAAFNSCVSLLQGAGGIIFIPRSSSIYCIKTGVVVNSGSSSTGSIIFQGSNPISGSAVGSCGGNTTPIFTLNNQWVQIKNLTVYGFGSLEDPFASALPTQPAILLSSGCSSCRIQDVYVTGGTAAIQINGACGYVLDNVWASFTYGDNAHVFGFVNNINCGGAVIDSHLDMAWPVSQPAHGIANPVAWANGVAITTGALRTVTCLTRTWLVQAASTGVTGGSTPPCHQYGTTMTDGGVLWKLVTFLNSSAFLADTGSVEIQILQTDMTAATYFGFRAANTFAGNGPTQYYLTAATPGGTLFQPIEIDSGSHVTIVGTEVSYCAVTGCAGMILQTGFSSFLTASNMRLMNGLSYGVILSSGSFINLSNNIVTSADTFGMFVNANVTHFVLSGNLLGSNITGQSLGTAASATIDYCNIVNNIFHGATTPTFNQGAGSCANKTLTGNL